MTSRGGQRPATAPDVVAPDFPAQHATTQGFSLGAPRGFTLTASRLLFLRGTAESPTQRLWLLDDDGERLLADADVLAPHTAADLTPEERARRERARERGSGIVSYATDQDADLVALTLGGKLLRIDVASGEAVQLAVSGPVVDPRPDPTGTHIAYVEQGALWVVRADGTNAPRRLCADRHPRVTWGLAEFVAGEEMGRTRGFWWAPDGRRLLAARVDTSPVHEWWIAAPVDPDQRPESIRYPAAGTPNAIVGLGLVDLNGQTTQVDWDTDRWPYLADVVWSADGPVADDGTASAILVVQSRDQTEVALLAVAPDGTTTPLVVDRDDPWIELIPGSPTVLADGSIARVVQTDDTRRVRVTSPGAHDGDGTLLGPVELMVAEIVGGGTDQVIVRAHPRARPWSTLVVRLDRTDASSVLRTPDGVADARVATAPDGGRRLLLIQRTQDATGATATLHEPDGTTRTVRSAAMPAPTLPARRIGPDGGDGQPVRVLHLPDRDDDAPTPLPVLIDSYGGPHARRVLDAGGTNMIAEWFAANGFAVLTVDGPGAPGQSLSWESVIHGDLAGPTLQGQIDALEATAAENPGLLDLDRVAIRGWSFGGYLAALAVLRRPDVFAAAVSGAPVTDWRLYDTHYTERYLGLPGDPDDPDDPYRRSSIIDDAREQGLTRPLLLIHGLADDNVVVAHALRLSRALLESGSPHEVLPLSGVTHFTPSVTIVANLLLHQLHFLRRALGLDGR